MNLAGPRIDLRPDHWVVVREILKRYVPDRDVLAFGSRATWTAKHHSDLDLAVLGDGPLSLDVMSMLAEAFGESNLPFKVDVVDWALADDAFRSIVRRDGVAVQNHKGRMRSSDGADTERISPDKKQQVVHSSMQTHVDRVPLRDLVQLTLSSVDKKRKQNEHDVLLCNYMDVYSNAFIHSDINFLAATATEREIDRCGLRIGDVIITKDSEAYDDIGVPALVREDIPSLVCGYHLAILRSSPRVLDSTYLYYVLQVPEVQHQFHAFANGVTRFGLRKDDIHRIEIPVHALDEQRAIADILGALDDKIELNRHMNETLQAIARALFKSWFVDFEPVRAKMAGLDTGLARTIADHFPGQINEHGIPKGWHRPQLGQLITVLETGRRPKGGVTNIRQGIPSVGAESIVKVGHFDFSKTKYVQKEYFDGMSQGHVSDGDVLVYKDGGKPGELRPAVTYVSGGFPFHQFCINEHVFRVRTNAVSQQMLYMALSTEDAFWQMKELATGVAQPGLNQSAVRSLRITMPNDGTLMQHADTLIGPLLDKCNRNSLEGHKLASVRNLLLPRLIGGEIRVKQAEKLAEEVL